MTLRYSQEETSAWDSDTLTSDIGKFTISPSYVFTDNLSGLIEFSSYDEDATGNIDYDGDGNNDSRDIENLLAVELIYTF